LLRILAKFLMGRSNRIQQDAQLPEVVVMRHPSPHMLPDVFLGIKLRRVGWQLFDLDLTPAFLQQLCRAPSTSS
jgi:hypothetical protein